MDQCNWCECCGIIDKCLDTKCSQHESWIGKWRINRIKELENSLISIRDIAQYQDWMRRGH